MIHDGNYKLLPGEGVPKFSLKGTDGKTYTLEDFKKPVVVMVFMCNHCPYVHAVEEDLKAFTKKYHENVDVIGVNANNAATHPQDSFSAMQKRVNERGFTFTYLHDESQEWAKAAGGQLTPQFMVLDEKRTVQYQGKFGMPLTAAVEVLLAGKTVPNPVTTCEGCSIKWK